METRSTTANTGVLYAYFRACDFGDDEHYYRWYKVLLGEDGIFTKSNTSGKPIELKPICPRSPESLYSVVVGLGSYIYTIGGESDDIYKDGESDDDDPSDRVRFFSTTSGDVEWKDAPNMNVPRSQPDVLAMNGKLYVMDGTISSFRDEWLVEVFDPVEFKWLKFPVELHEPHTSLYSMLNPKKEPLFAASMVPVNEHSFLILSNFSHAYLYDTNDHSLTPKKNITASPHSFRMTQVVYGRTVYRTTWDDACRNQEWGGDPSSWAETFLEGFDMDNNFRLQHCIQLEDVKSSCFASKPEMLGMVGGSSKFTNGRHFHVMWLHRKNSGKPSNKVRLGSYELPDSGKLRETQTTFSNKSVRCYLSGLRDTYLDGGVVLYGEEKGTKKSQR